MPVELGRALTQPVAAVRAFGDVRAHFGPAVLADHEEIWAAGAHRPKFRECDLANPRPADRIRLAARKTFVSPTEAD